MSKYDRDVVVTIQHPANVHFFRNAIHELSEAGYNVHVFAREKDIACDLLDVYDIEYTLLAGEAHSLFQLVRVQAKYEYEILKRTRKMDGAVLLAVSEPAITHASTCFNCRSILFTDTEHATIQNTLAYPFADVICTPASYWGDLGSKHVRYAGNHQLAYLHPNRFEPDPTVLDAAGVDEDEQLVLIRLIAWEAAHDIGHGGLGNTEAIVEQLERAGATVLITSETELPRQLRRHEVDIPPHKILDLMYYSDLYLGEGSTMALESAVLGTPAMYVSSYSAGVVDELEREYGLAFRYDEDPDETEILDRALSLLAEQPETWQSRRDQYLEENTDTTDFIVEAVEAAMDN
ncbi:DUF354 domain-containing protein [Halobacteria archaeon AArc-m2/3/4]|uniref:DUF354 domain-containing protein n=1 Tax=Natronoglomus mannanivorans TaxID=2979990 RepID=A0ABT2QK93_9EURY|nr:DUF354 domain-containing protein [Halobacteria archaeon AArc-m2/3/4]